MEVTMVGGPLDGRVSELRVADLASASEAMGIDWMTWDEIREAIPPAFTKFIGEQFMAQVPA